MGKIDPMHQKGVVAHLGGLRNTAGMAMGSQNFEFQDYIGLIKLSPLEFRVVPKFLSFFGRFSVVFQVYGDSPISAIFCINLKNNTEYVIRDGHGRI